MPLYDYKCSACARVTEVRHGFDEANSKVCPSCGGALRRVFNAAPILFKGSGFYINDSRSKPSGDSAATSSDSKSPDAKPGESTPLPAAKEASGSSSSDAGSSSAPPAPAAAPSESKPSTAA